MTTRIISNWMSGWIIHVISTPKLPESVLRPACQACSECRCYLKKRTFEVWLAVPVMIFSKRRYHPKMWQSWVTHNLCPSKTIKHRRLQPQNVQQSLVWIGHIGSTRCFIIFIVMLVCQMIFFNQNHVSTKWCRSRADSFLWPYFVDYCREGLLIDQVHVTMIPIKFHMESENQLIQKANFIHVYHQIFRFHVRLVIMEYMCWGLNSQ